MIGSLSFVDSFISFKSDGKMTVGVCVAEKRTAAGVCVAVCRYSDNMLYHVVLRNTGNTCTSSLHIGYDVKNLREGLEKLGYNHE